MQLKGVLIDSHAKFKTFFFRDAAGFGVLAATALLLRQHGSPLAVFQ
jgi:hypothetical protein